MPKYHVQIVIGGRLPVDKSREFLEEIEAISAFQVDLKPRSADPMASWTNVPLGGRHQVSAVPCCCQQSGDREW